MITLTIDGKTTEVEEGTTILEAARDLGIEIPTLCYHKALVPYQACRVCLVEMIRNGTSKLVPSCGYKVEQGIEVKTSSPRVMRYRKLLMEILLARAPASSEIQELAKQMGVEKSRFKIEDEEEKCILCGLCVRVCNELMGIGAIGFAQRGAKMEVTPPFKEFSEVCSTCGACDFVCPTGAVKLEDTTEKKILPIFSKFDVGLAKRPCVYIPFPQAVPNKPVIDKENCMFFKNGSCKICEKVCQPQAINYEQEDSITEEEVGAIVVATGYDLYPLADIGEYGYGKYKDVIDGLQFERLLSASGPTLGQIRRPSDGKVPKEVVFIKCVRSRDQERGLPYCSKICCMYSAKHAMLYKHRVPDGQAYVFYMDIRAGGKGYEEFVQRATEEDEVLYLRGRVSKVFQHGDKLIVWGTDTLTGEKIEIAADLVVLATAIVPNKATADLVKKLKLPTDPYGFLSEAHPKLRPVEFISSGLYLAGCSQAPKDIPETVAQASGAASKVVNILSREELFHDPAITGVDEDICCGCGICVDVCPYGARELDTEKKVVEVNLALCEGCGVCGAACPTGAAQPKNFTDKQLLEMVSAILRD